MHLCEMCGAPVHRSNQRFCSRTCASKSRRMLPPSMTCAFCGGPLKEGAHHWERYCSTTCSNRAKAAPLAERFWAKVAKSEGCWEWQGNQGRHGYGRLRSTSYHSVFAHRVAWELTYGPIPDGLEVCHKCDNPPCCRPDHLFLGTSAENLADMRAKGRGARGERHGSAKLLDSQVMTIRQRLAAGANVYSLASEYDVTPDTIWLIRRRRTWQHL